MNMIQTTLGAIEPNMLGRTNVHEHIIINGANNKKIPADFIHVEVAKIAAEVQLWKAAGGGVLIDSSPIGVGRDINKLVQVSQLSSVPIIVSTGFHKLTYYPSSHWLYESTSGELAKIISDEILKGVLLDDAHPHNSKKSIIKAGMLKIGIDSSGITPTIDKLFTAIADTINQLGLVCMIHTEAGVPFNDVIDWIERHAVRPEKILSCQMGKSLDRDLHLSLANNGYYLEYDSIIRHTPSLRDLSEVILELFDRGYGNKVLFAGDFARRSYWKCFGGQPGLKFLISGLNKDLIKLGFSEKMIDKIWVDNPRDWLS